MENNEERKVTRNILSTFFSDENVRFPKKPQLVNGIHVYEAPRGLGIQFRGGTEKFMVRGKYAHKVWTFLSDKLDGSHSLNDLLNEADLNGLDGVSVGTFLKTLHSYHLLVPDEIVKDVNNTITLDLFSDKQAQYYDRIVAKSGLNKDGASVLGRIADCKILIIGNDYLIPFISYQLKLAGFEDMGFIVVSDSNKDDMKEYLSDSINIMTYTNLNGLDDAQIRDVLSSKIPDYQYVLTAMNNPCTYFENEITRQCTIYNKPILTMSVRGNSYEIGPFYFPETGTSCKCCHSLREISNSNDSIYEYVYQDELRKQNMICDTFIKGIDFNSFSVVVNMAICQFKNALSNVSQPKLIGTVFKFNCLDYTFSQNPVIKVAACPSCSSVNVR